MFILQSLDCSLCDRVPRSRLLLLLGVQGKGSIFAVLSCCCSLAAQINSCNPVRTAKFSWVLGLIGFPFPCLCGGLATWGELLVLPTEKWGSMMLFCVMSLSWAAIHVGTTSPASAEFIAVRQHWETPSAESSSCNMTNIPTSGLKIQKNKSAEAVLCCRAPSAFLWTASTDPVSRRKTIQEMLEK